jgi:hypothetical protein
VASAIRAIVMLAFIFVARGILPQRHRAHRVPIDPDRLSVRLSAQHIATKGRGESIVPPPRRAGSGTGRNRFYGRFPALHCVSCRATYNRPCGTRSQIGKGLDPDPMRSF